ncbi:MAG: hypothetical protein JZU50_06940 [Desulfobulbaceae bacterium]|nr:hypothetical protein [Desulfobulbaceae bacterium]
MEMTTYFTGMILSVCAIHMASVTVSYVHKLWAKYSGGEKRVNDQSLERSDWYVFFHCSDLLGVEQQKNSFENKEIHKANAINQSKPQNRRSVRMQAR